MHFGRRTSHCAPTSHCNKACQNTETRDALARWCPCTTPSGNTTEIRIISLTRMHVLVFSQRRSALHLSMQTKTPFDQASAIATSAAIAMAAVNQAVSMKALEVKHQAMRSCPHRACPTSIPCVCPCIPEHPPNHHNSSYINTQKNNEQKPPVTECMACHLSL
jgi:hypothetical protein